MLYGVEGEVGEQRGHRERDQLRRKGEKELSADIPLFFVLDKLGKARQVTKADKL